MFLAVYNYFVPLLILTLSIFYIYGYLVAVGYARDFSSDEVRRSATSVGLWSMLLPAPFFFLSFAVGLQTAKPLQGIAVDLPFLVAALLGILLLIVGLAFYIVALFAAIANLILMPAILVLAIANAPAFILGCIVTFHYLFIVPSSVKESRKARRRQIINTDEFARSITKPDESMGLWEKFFTPAFVMRHAAAHLRREAAVMAAENAHANAVFGAAVDNNWRVERGPMKEKEDSATDSSDAPVTDDEPHVPVPVDGEVVSPGQSFSMGDELTIRGTGFIRRQEIKRETKTLKAETGRLEALEEYLEAAERAKRAAYALGDTINYGATLEDVQDGNRKREETAREISQVKADTELTNARVELEKARLRLETVGNASTQKPKPQTEIERRRAHRRQRREETVAIKEEYAPLIAAATGKERKRLMDECDALIRKLFE